MTSLKNTDFSFIIYGFMTGRLGLRMNELCIFAMIYSFTCGRGGFYYGTQGYLADACGTSLSTVKRALDALIEKGYIERCEIDGRSGYRSCVFESDFRAPTLEAISVANADTEPQKQNEKTAQKATKQHLSTAAKEETTAKSLGAAKNFDEDYFDCGTEYDDYDEELEALPIDALPPPHVVEDRELNITRLLGRGAAPPKFEFYQFGRNGFVTMTAGQYRQLLKLVREEQLHAYICRLEELMTEKGYRTFSPYKTLKKWITEDTAE